ncbi:hypothetical protein E2542_SST06652 [Spatholobus suberectus]|nr:hypothetical protein E2542_SST06652 [Spatholobus suberectus]
MTSLVQVEPYAHPLLQDLTSPHAAPPRVTSWTRPRCASSRRVSSPHDLASSPSSRLLPSHHLPSRVATSLPSRRPRRASSIRECFGGVLLLVSGFDLILALVGES